MKHKLQFLFVGIALAAVAAAQTGKLSGRLSGGSAGDKSTMVIILTNANTSAPVRVRVAPDGSFSAAVPPGTYRVEVESQGRRQAASQNLEIVSGSNATLTVQIAVGEVSETLQIQAEAPAAEDDPPDVGRSYTTRTVRELPVFDRNYQELIGLMPGVTPPTTNYSRTVDPQRSRQYNTDGLPAYANDTMTDGTSIREPFTGLLTVRVLPDEAVEQLNVRTSNYPADHGFAAGTISNVFTRPGTNGLHGSVFGFFSDSYLATRQPLLPPGLDQPLHHWQYGASAGGALIPDSMFLFLSYEGTRQRAATPQFASVPTAAMIGGNFAGLGTTLFNPATGTIAGTGRTSLGTTISPVLINPTSRAILSALPAPNLPGFSNNLAADVPYSTVANIGDAKLDYRFSDALTGFLRYGISHINTNEDSIFGPIAGSPTNSGLRNHHGSVSLVGNYYGILGELRFGYSRYRNAIYPENTSGSLRPFLSPTAFPSGLPSIDITGLGVLGPVSGLPSRDISNLYEGSANFGLNRGGHQFKFGVDVRANQSNGFQDLFFSHYGPTGNFLFGPGPTSLAGTVPASPNSVFASSVAAFLLGAPTVRSVFTPAFAPSYHQNQYGLYISDLIHITPRLALDLGIRWDIYSPIDARYDAGNMFFNPATNSVTFGNRSFNGDYDLNNVAPRAGVAFKFTEKTIFRGGYSMNYFAVPFAYAGLNPAGTGTIQGVTGSFAPTTFAVPAVPPATGTTAPNIAFAFPTNFQTPYTQNYYAMIQQEIHWGFLFDAGYVGNTGRQLPYFQQINAAAPGTGLIGLPFATAGRTAPVTEIGQGVTSNYNSLQVNLTKQLSKGTSFAMSYTFSKALDYGTNLVNNFDRSANYGPADWDRRHVLTLSHLFALPVGLGSPHWSSGVLGQILANWELGGLFRWATGAPYTVLADPIACACPGIATIPANPTAASSSANGSGAVPASLFALPGLNSGGLLGRNSVHGPDMAVYNMSLMKSFAVRENWKLELRGEAYNLTNSVVIANPPSNVSFGNFGQSTSTFNGVGGRTFLVGGRMLF